MNRKRVFRGRLINVFKGEKKLPDGRKAYFEEIDHPGAALVVPFIKDKVVFIRQYRAVIGRFIWELPAGTLYPGESPRVCARREVMEETGYPVKNLRKIGNIYTTPGFCNEKIHVFKADCEGRKSPSREDDELIRVKLLSEGEIRRLFKSGRITDSKTIAALSFAGVLCRGA